MSLIAGITIAALTNILVESVVKTGGSEAVKSLKSGIKKLWDKHKSNKDIAKASKALEDLEGEPEDEDYLNTFKSKAQKALASPELADELKKLLESVEKETGESLGEISKNNSINVSGNDNVVNQDITGSNISINR